MFSYIIHVNWDCSSDASIYYNKNADVSVYEQTYVFPSAVTAMATTSTKFGIATKDLVGACTKSLFIPRLSEEADQP